MKKSRKLHFGSGVKILKDYINIDVTPEYGADVICDMNKFPFPFKDNSADEILCVMTLEHIQHPTQVMQEFHRIISPKGEIKIVVPHFSALYAFHADIHVRTYGVGFFYSFKNDHKDLWDNSQGKMWDQTKVTFKDVDVKMLFPKGKLTALSVPFQLIFGQNKTLQGVYEQFFCYLYRANEIHAVLKNKVR